MSDQLNQPRFMTLSQVADELNVKQSLVQGLIRTGEMRGFQVGDALPCPGRGRRFKSRQDRARQSSSYQEKATE